MKNKSRRIKPDPAEVVRHLEPYEKVLEERIIYCRNHLYKCPAFWGEMIPLWENKLQEVRHELWKLDHQHDRNHER